MIMALVVSENFALPIGNAEIYYQFKNRALKKFE